MQAEPLCDRPGCFNPKRSGSNFCKPCGDVIFRGRGTGRDFKFCSTPGCDGEAVVYGMCEPCCSEAAAVGERAIREAVKAEDPRIAKLEAVAADPAATEAERASARTLIERLRNPEAQL